MNCNIEAFFGVSFRLDADACVVEVIVILEAFASTKKVIMHEGEVKVFECVTDVLVICGISVCEASLVMCAMILFMMIVMRSGLKSGGFALVRRSAKEKSNPNVPIQRL